MVPLSKSAQNTQSGSGLAHSSLAGLLAVPADPPLPELPLDPPFEPALPPVASPELPPELVPPAPPAAELPPLADPDWPPGLADSLLPHAAAPRQSATKKNALNMARAGCKAQAAASTRDLPEIRATPDPIGVIGVRTARSGAVIS